MERQTYDDLMYRGMRMEGGLTASKSKPVAGLSISSAGRSDSAIKKAGQI